MLAYLHVSISLHYKFKLNLQSTLPFAETWRPNFQQLIQMHFLKILRATLLTEDRILKCLSNYCIEHSHTNVFRRRPDLEMPKLYECVYLFFFLISYNELLIYSCIVFFISCPKRKNCIGFHCFTNFLPLHFIANKLCILLNRRHVISGGNYMDE